MLAKFEFSLWKWTFAWALTDLPMEEDEVAAEEPMVVPLGFHSELKQECDCPCRWEDVEEEEEGKGQSKKTKMHMGIRAQ